jgi:acetylglutamate kinase
VKQLFVIKVGGNVIDDEHSLDSFLEKFSRVPFPKILVHGGGKIATEISARLGIEARMVEGKRITDKDTLKIVTMVYAGYVNKTIVGKMNRFGNKTLGICGADLNLIPARKRTGTAVDYGYVGDITASEIPAEQWTRMLEKDICPVVAPITADSSGSLLNTNADTIASALAQALCRTYMVTLIYCFEKDGVLQNPGDNSSVIRSIAPETYSALKGSGVISKGMIPKLDKSFEALHNGVTRVVVGNAMKLDELIHARSGTVLALN